MISRNERRELTNAIHEYESTAIPGGGGYLECLKACVNWENCFRKYESRLSRNQVKRFKARAAWALNEALKP